MADIRDPDMENRIIDINHKLQRTSKMEYVIENTRTNAGSGDASPRLPLEGILTIKQ